MVVVGVRPVPNARILQARKDLPNLSINWDIFVVKVVKAAVGELTHDGRGNGTRVQDWDLGRRILLNPGDITSTSGGGMIGHLIFGGGIGAGN